MALDWLWIYARDLWNNYKGDLPAIAAIIGIFGSFGLWGWLRARFWRKEAREQQERIRRVELAAKQKDEESIWELSEPNLPRWLKKRYGGLSLPIIAVANLKGGVGKTTTSAYLAHCFSKHMGLRVLAVDLDYQGSLTGLLDKNEDTQDQSGISNLLRDGVSESIFHDNVITELPNYDGKLFLISASSNLAQLENTLLLEWLLDRDGFDVRYRLARNLSLKWVRRSFDVVILDTPPRMTVSTFNAFAACSHVIVPTPLKATSYNRVAHFVNLLTKIKKNYNSGLTVAGITLTLTRGGGSLTGPEVNIKNQISDELPKQLDDVGMIPRIFDQHIPRWDCLAEGDFSENCTEPYVKLATEIWQQVSPKQRKTK